MAAETVAEALDALHRLYSDEDSWCRASMCRFSFPKQKHCYCLAGGIALVCGNDLSDVTTALGFLRDNPVAIGVCGVVARMIDPLSLLHPLEIIIPWNDEQKSVGPVLQIIEKARESADYRASIVT